MEEPARPVVVLFQRSESLQVEENGVRVNDGLGKRCASLSRCRETEFNFIKVYKTGVSVDEALGIRSQVASLKDLFCSPDQQCHPRKGPDPSWCSIVRIAVP